MQDILKALSWPHFVFLFAVLFVLTFRAQIAGLLARVTSIDKTGIKAGQATPELQREDTKRLEAASELMLAVGSSVALEDLETRIRDDLKARALPVDGETPKVLIKYLAAAYLVVQFEQVQALIFGSQIYLMKKLNESVGLGRPLAFAEKHFDHVKTMFPDAFGEWGLDQYLDFLLRRQLVIKKEGDLHITDLGVEYLVWQARSGRTESRNL